jgi:2-phospho-L-lactate guanylyltransferase
VETAVLIPIKSFHGAKARLRPALSDETRERLARWMAERVVTAARPLPTFVACDDDSVAAWAESLRAEVVWGPGLGLNGAIDHGVDLITAKGADHVVIAHGDLPLPERITSISRSGQVVLVPDRRFDGTNVMSRPCDAALSAAYGGGSFRRHLAAALRTGLPVSVRADPHLSIDVDTIDDCRHPLVAPLLGPLLGDTA